MFKGLDTLVLLVVQILHVIHEPIHRSDNNKFQILISACLLVLFI